MLNCSASLAMSTSILKALPGKDTHLVFSITLPSMCHLLQILGGSLEGTGFIQESLNKIQGLFKHF